MKLVVDNLYKLYKKHTFFNRKEKRFTINGLSFFVAEGEVYALVGQNGVGKTTTIKCILRFIKYNKGSIFIENGEDMEELMIQSNVGYMPENLLLTNMITLREFLDDLSVLRGMDKKNTKYCIAELAEKMGMSDFLDKNISKFSKGMKRKVNFMQAVLNNPKLLILDEPTDGLDPISRRSVLNYIRKMADEGSMIIMTSHILSDLEAICDKVGFVKGGRLISEISPKDLFNKNESIVKLEITNLDNKNEIIELKENEELCIRNYTALKLRKVKFNGITMEEWYYNILLKEEEQSNVESD